MRQDEQLRAARRMLAAREAANDLLVFNRLRMSDPDDPDDVTRTRFESTPLARLLCQIIERAVKGSGKRRIAVSVGPQFGKALVADTPIATPGGFTLIGALCPGDLVFDERGQPCSVVARTPVWRDRPVYKVHTDDGFSVVADAEHDWLVRVSKSYPVYKRKTTRHLAEKEVLRNPLIMPSDAIHTCEAALPVAPYVLGAWLGDGTSANSRIAAVGDDGLFIEQEIRREGYHTARGKDGREFGVYALWSVLRELNLFRNKHIPAVYLRAGRVQRLALLQGLVDTDGYVQPGGAIEISQKSGRLARDIRELVVSLGVKCGLAYGRASLYGKDCGPRHRLHFYMEDAARLPRKRERCRNVERCAGRYLTFSEGGVADTVCIEVDSPSHQFLCGDGMIATCNSDVLSRSAPAWIIGKNPLANIILGTYNQPFANEFGDAVREIIRAPFYKQVFPGIELRREQTDYLATTAGGRLSFVGRGGSGTGKPADYFFVDDPIKDDIEAQSTATREETWHWYNRVAMTRCHSKTVIIVVHTRWSGDDLIGRLVDQEHPERNKSLRGVHKYWDYYNIPAVIDDPKLAKALGLTLEPPTSPDVISMFGAKPMSSLWPGRKDLELLAEAKLMDPTGFTSLYMGKPTANEGEFFRADWLLEYDPEDLPKNLTCYGASDHAVSTRQGKDYTVIGCVGVDDKDDIWVLPDIVWDRIQTDRSVEEILSQMEIHQPACWWMESELISKSFGPFLYKRMDEKRIYTPIDAITPAKDKRTMARSIQGRMQMRKVHFPRFAHWWPDARAQLLRFDSGAYDDFVSFMSMVGLGMFKQFVPDEEPEAKEVVLHSGSIKWILQKTALKAQREKTVKVVAGW